jgi:hypothetical protein
MSTVIFHVEPAAEGGFIARAAGHSIFTEAATLNELHTMVQNALECHFASDAAISYQFIMAPNNLQGTTTL